MNLFVFTCNNDNDNNNYNNWNEQRLYECYVSCDAMMQWNTSAGKKKQKGKQAWMHILIVSTKQANGSLKKNIFSYGMYGRYVI